MLRLVFEAVMILAIVSCLFFLMKVTAQENQDKSEEPDNQNPE